MLDGQPITYFHPRQIDRGKQGWLLLPKSAASVSASRRKVDRYVTHLGYFRHPWPFGMGRVAKTSRTNNRST
ncbi:hypothetical protein [Brevibacillus choshinensis]|uniref:hypothetical protein n=1 Tax=Brevibacillus choshinensis TaxID=54911 RepID=UPI002E1A0B0E|nr:hypothetical protein [Brevibacillus choshinensis]